jgi:hypothetical protein
MTIDGRDATDQNQVNPNLTPSLHSIHPRSFWHQTPEERCRCQRVRRDPDRCRRRRRQATPRPPLSSIPTRWPRSLAERALARFSGDRSCRAAFCKGRRGGGARRRAGGQLLTAATSGAAASDARVRSACSSVGRERRRGVLALAGTVGAPAVPKEKATIRRHQVSPNIRDRVSIAEKRCKTKLGISARVRVHKIGDFDFC